LGFVKGWGIEKKILNGSFSRGIDEQSEYARWTSFSSPEGSPLPDFFRDMLGGLFLRARVFAEEVIEDAPSGNAFVEHEKASCGKDPT